MTRIQAATDTTRAFKREGATSHPMLALAGGKGGCGKTTTTLGLAGTLARRGFDPLVVDADCDMPNVHHVANVERTDGVSLLAEGVPLERAITRSTSFPGVALLTAGSRTEMDAALRATARWHGPVLIDCPAGVSPDATRPLRHADRTLVVSTDEPQCLADTALTVTTARELAADPVGALVRERAGSAPVSVADCEVLVTVPSVQEPFDSPRLARAWDNLGEVLYPRRTHGTNWWTTHDECSYTAQKRRR